jgi:predicted nuclease of predicted toxin-antitoxin system
MLAKVDEDLPKSLARVLRNNGYDAATVVEQQMSGWDDDRLWQAIQSERGLLVTADKNAADVRCRPFGTDAGILLLRPEYEGAGAVTQLLLAVLAKVDLQDLRGAICVATPARLRIRRAPQG